MHWDTDHPELALACPGLRTQPHRTDPLQEVLGLLGVHASVCLGCRVRVPIHLHCTFCKLPEWLTEFRKHFIYFL